MTIDDKALDEYEAMAAAATPGPLTASRGDVFPSVEIQEALAVRNLGPQIAICYGKNAVAHANAEFFARSRTMGPAICAALRAERAEVARLRGAMENALEHAAKSEDLQAERTIRGALAAKRGEGGGGVRTAKQRAAQRKAETKAFDTWTAPIGTVVDVVMDDCRLFRSVTMSMPWKLGDGTPVIKVDGIGGGYLLTRVRVVESGDGGEKS